MATVLDNLLCRLGIHRWQRAFGMFDAIILICSRCQAKTDI